jgi:formiminoglutamase
MDTSEFSFYLSPIEIPDYKSEKDIGGRRIGDIINTYSNHNGFPSLKGVEIAIVGVREDRLSNNNIGCASSPAEVRKYLYRLYKGNFDVKITDIGDILPGSEVKDTYFALTNVLTELLHRSILPIIIGGSQDLTYAQYRAYENLGQIINIVSVDPEFDLGNDDEHIDSKSFLSHIILHQPNYLFNYTNIGYQTYFVDDEAISLMRNMYFDVYRLGQIRSDLEEAEPLVRNADMLSFDVSAIRSSDAPGNNNAGPNGFYGEEACQIARYAGLSDKMSSIGFYEMNPVFDRMGQTAHLLAQMIWYFIDGYCNRKSDFPFMSKDDYLKYIVSENNSGHDITFYKSKKSDRWWMNVPCTPGQSQIYERHYLVPCSYNDYQEAMRNEIPERWWQVYQKLLT